MPTPALWLTSVIIICLLMMGMLFSLSRSGIPGVATTACGAAVTCVAVALTAAPPLLAGGLPVPVRLLGGVLLGVDMALYFVAVRQFFGLGVPKAALAVLLLLYALALAAFWYVSTDFSMRTAIVSTMRGLMAGLIAVTVLRHRPAGQAAYPYVFTVAMAGALALMHAWRAVVYFLRLDGIGALWQSSTVNTIYLSIGLVTLPGIMLGMILMIHDRMLEQRVSKAVADSRGRQDPRRP
ncbi:hypothetical protein [Bordetella genomosp. 10]|uniref:hypothetical protein n=1 Tax=Bordetella genomosp. 10 TaxID=1416804 RepID=UPI00117733BC|nr:hypothetical protein [Bordetella genomosp. 10]